MTSTGATSGSDPVGAGISRGLDRAAKVDLPNLDVEKNAQALVSSALERRPKRQPTPPQIELLAEFVTVALAAGVTYQHVDGWIVDLCGDWG